MRPGRRGKHLADGAVFIFHLGIHDALVIDVLEPPVRIGDVLQLQRDIGHPPVPDHACCIAVILVGEDLFNGGTAELFLGDKVGGRRQVSLRPQDLVAVVPLGVGGIARIIRVLAIVHNVCTGNGFFIRRTYLFFGGVGSVRSGGEIPWIVIRLNDLLVVVEAALKGGQALPVLQQLEYFLAVDTNTYPKNGLGANLASLILRPAVVRAGGVGSGTLVVTRGNGQLTRSDVKLFRFGGFIVVVVPQKVHKEVGPAIVLVTEVQLLSGGDRFLRRCLFGVGSGNKP